MTASPDLWLVIRAHKDRPPVAVAAHRKRDTAETHARSLNDRYGANAHGASTYVVIRESSIRAKDREEA